MRISELSRRSGVPVATIKYYLREDLLPKGEAVSATQSDYSQAHVDRLRLVRSLVEVADVPLARIRAVLDALDNPGVDLHTLLGTALYALADAPEAPTDDPLWNRAEERTSGLLADLDWQVTSLAPARAQLAQALAAMDGLGYPVSPEMLHGYADAAHRVAETDISFIDPTAPREDALVCTVTLSAFMEQALAALRRLAQEDESTRRFGPGRTDPDSGSEPPGAGGAEGMGDSEGD